MPPPSNNENQGLKIAVACFVMLSVILAVTTYFGFKYYMETDKKLVDAMTSAGSEKKEQERLTRILTDFKDKVGLSKTEFDDLPKAADKSVDELTKKAVAVRDAANKAIDEAKSSGASLGQLDVARQSLDTIIAAINDPARTVLSTADRYAEITSNLAIISSMLAVEFETTRKNLEDTNGVNQAKLDVESRAAQDSKADLESEVSKHETDRQALGAKVGQLQDDTSRQAQEIAKLKNQIALIEDESRKRIEDLRNQVIYFREMTEKTETTLDKKDGTLTFVDYGRGEVRTDLTRTQGAREQMVFSIFDKNASGLPSDKPKGTIELIQVGSTGSVGRIVKTERSVDPFREGDQVYSPAWDSGDPKQFALIGKIDMDRDGRDDRDDLKRMIRASGGTVVYDLPPDGVGQETGNLSARIAWYVLDERDPFHPSTQRESKTVSEDHSVYLNKKTEAIKTARADGIRPKLIQNLLSELGYAYGSSVPGRVEATNRAAINELLNPRGKVGAIPGEGGSEGNPEG